MAFTFVAESQNKPVIMHYKLMVNQPFQSTANVLAAAFRFVTAYDPGLLRLEERWRNIPGGIAIHDSFNNQDLPIGREASGEEYNPDDRHFFTDGYGNYRLLEELDRSRLNDILEVFNDLYGADCFAVIKTPIGYGYYKCVND